MKKIVLDDKGLGLALETISHGKPYLGDIAVIDGLLRKLAKGAFDRREAVALGRQGSSPPGQADQEACLELADILLGRKPDAYAPQPTWNAPGSVDDHVAQVLNITDDEPRLRLATAAATFLLQIYAILAYAQNPGVPEEYWMPQIDATFEEFTSIFLGVPLDTSA